MKWHRRFHLWFRLARRKVTPWLVLVIATLKLTWTCGAEHTKEQARLMTALTKIGFVSWFELAQEIVDDLPYWFY
ncbi:hypothetical protein H6F76_00065 [Leptolyngbya sp. FACHB-321]|uniref:hypothetical protein n=1 Tax=Leptolyngbya sp. FACHB-321 TaxID=2692807 RepID=UPI0016833CE4|nr:hypothetical protein [Leptolyngbya sp. FACHB-321]MBD2033463.1 hypothetical protein [Leptolyngbya sp. FACHB-321]